MTRRDEVQQFPATNQLASAVAFSPDGEHLAVACEPGKIFVWHVRSGKEVASWTDVKTGSIAFRNDGRFLFTGHDDGTIRIWETSTWQRTNTIRAHSRRVLNLKSTADGKTLLSSGSDGVVQVRSSDSFEPRTVIPIGPSGVPVAFGLDASGQYLFASGPAPVIFVYRLPSD